MLKKFQAVCVKCRTRFDVRQGSSKTYHILHCNRCGREKKVSVNDLPEFCRHSLIEYIRACTFSSENSSDTIASTAPIDERKYRFMVEHRAGLCVCGSMFKFSGKARCPNCRSSVFRISPDRSVSL